jgi:hypothetical protein
MSVPSLEHIAVILVEPQNPGNIGMVCRAMANFGASDPKAGACGSLRNIVADARLNHRVRTLPPRRAAECGALLTTFFRARRPASGPGCLPSDGCL